MCLVVILEDIFVITMNRVRIREQMEQVVGNYILVEVTNILKGTKIKLIDDSSTNKGGNDEEETLVQSIIL